jgi:arylsulfatase A-like enzyme
MKKTIFKDSRKSLWHRIKSGIKAGFIIGFIPGLVEGEAIFLSLKGFDNSAWMLLIAPALYGIIGIIFGMILGFAYHCFFEYIKSSYNDFSVILSAIIVLILLAIILVGFNESFVFPRFHPVSIAIDLLIFASAYFLLKPLAWCIEQMRKVRKTIYAISFLAVCLIFAVYNLNEYKNIKRMPSPPADRSTEMRLDNIIILMMDTVRADHLSCYGYERKVSPEIDALASQGILFERHFSSSSWTVPAHFSMMTGITSGAVRQEFSISPKSVTLAERIRLLGYRTACLSANPLLSKGINFDQGFDILDCDVNIINRINNLKLFDLLSHLKIRRPIHTNAIKTFNSAELITDYAIDWIEKSDKEPYFLFVNYMDAHDPYLPPARYRNLFNKDYKGKFTGDICGDLSEAEFIRDIVPTMTSSDWKYIISQYDAAIKYIDDQVGRIAAYLKKQDSLNNTILIVLSDHGELFGEYNLATHHLTLSDEETHVPLIIHYPKVIKQPQRVKSLARIIDIYPTIKELIGFKLTDKIFIEGVPLIDKEGHPTSGAAFAPLVLYENAYKASVLGPAFKRNLFCYRTNEWKYLFPELNPKLNQDDIKGNIFRKEQIRERLQQIDENGKPLESDVPDQEKISTFRFLLNQWRGDILKKKPPLGDDRQSRRLLRDLADINYIKPY